MGLLFLVASSPAAAEIITIKVPSAGRTVDSQLHADTVTPEVDEPRRETLFNTGNRNLAFTHFTWGAEAGSSLDLTSHNLSTFDVDVLLGYKNPYIQMAGAGVGIHRSVSSGNYFVPLYAVFRTDFRKKPSLFFMNLQAGYSFNSVGDSETIGDFCGALGVGINLKRSRMAQSYLILSASYQHFSEVNKGKTDVDRSYIFFARLVIGVNF